MIKKISRPKQVNNQDKQAPKTIQELMQRYDLDNKEICDYLDYLVEQIATKYEQLTKINYITVGLSEHYTLTSKNATVLPLNKVIKKEGSKLSLTDDGGILIGKGVKHVRIDACVYYRTGQQSNDLTESMIRKNSVAISNNTSRTVGTTSESKTICSLPKDVEEGDIIYLTARNQTREGQQIGAFDALTFLSVEAL